MIVDVSGWGHLRVSGADTVRFLQSTCTVNVQALATGGHAWGCILSPKGRVLTVLQATRGVDDVVIHTEPHLTDATLALLQRYAVMDEVEFERLPGPAYLIWPAPGEVAAPAWDAPVLMADLPGPAAATGDVEIIRVEAGIPRHGVDVDEDHFPFETPLTRWLDYGKGCYIGQEPVFRVHSKGEAARTLRALVIEGDGPVAPGAAVVHAERASAGVVTSSVVSPRHGAIALAYLHRTVWAPGGVVAVDGRAAVVRELPI